MSAHRKKLVIGIDYGTTNSGVAYAVVTDPKDDNVDIEVLREWPHGKLADNIPSDIAYNEEGEPIAFASDCPSDVRPLQWVKLLLEPAGLGEKRPGTERIWHSMEALDRLGKHPVDVVADYLRWLWSEIEKSLEDSGDDVGTDETVVVITLPASWSDRAKNSMLQAAQKAGIDKNGRTLKFRAEPEAAAMWELKIRAKKKQIAVGDCFIVCDAGGGTVDVVSFQVLCLEPLSLNQVVVSEGDFCGSSFINTEFDAQIRSVLGSDYNKLGNETKARIRDEFEHTIKRKYTPEAPAEYSIPATGLEDNEQKGIKNGKMKVKDAILKRSFEEIMAQTLMLLDGQKEGLKAKNLLDKLTAVLLVGGFGGSKYLHARISQEYPKSENVKVWRGDHSWTAVVQGAVQCEVANREIYAPFNTRLSRYHYGIPYRRGGFKKVQWLIHKGQDVRDSSHIEPYLLRMENRDWLDEVEYAIIRVQLVKTDKDQVTEDLDSSLEPHVEIDCRVPTAIRYSSEASLVQENPKVWRIPAELILAMDGPLLTVRCRMQGKDVGLLDLKYHEEDDFPSHGLSAVQTMVEPELTATRETSPWPLSSRSSQISQMSGMSQDSQKSKDAKASVVTPRPLQMRPSHDSGKNKDEIERVLSPANAPATSSSHRRKSKESSNIASHYLSMFPPSPKIDGKPRKESTGSPQELPPPMPLDSQSDSRQSSTSPRPKSRPFWRRGSKTEQEEEDKGEQKQQERKRTERGSGSDRWVPFTNGNGEEMLRDQITGEILPGAPKHAQGYGLH